MTDNKIADPDGTEGNADSSDINPMDLPWKTAPEYVRQVLSDLDIDPESKVGEYAIELAHRYGLYQPTDHSPRTIAAGAVYLALTVHPESIAPKPVTQSPIEDSLGVDRSTISRTYRELAAEEGHSVPEGNNTSVDDDPKLNVIAEWIQRLFGDDQ